MIDTATLLFGLPLFSGSKQSLLDLMYLRVKEGKSVLKVATPNPEQVIQASQDTDFLKDLGNFDLLLPDGQGLVWASQLFSGRGTDSPLKQRITGREVVVDLLQFAKKEKKKVLVIGGRDYSGKSFNGITLVSPGKATSNGLYAVTWLPGYTNVREQTSEEERISSTTITELKPDIVFVAFGAPYQEAWVSSHQKLLKKAGVSLVMVVGGSFDYLLGMVPRVPRFMEVLGLEWFFRLVTQPWRWQRQLRLISFIGLTLKTFFSNKKPAV